MMKLDLHDRGDAYGACASFMFSHHTFWTNVNHQCWFGCAVPSFIQLSMYTFLGGCV